jgi:hypothetical protein
MLRVDVRHAYNAMLYGQGPLANVQTLIGLIEASSGRSPEHLPPVYNVLQLRHSNIIFAEKHKYGTQLHSLNVKGDR